MKREKIIEVLEKLPVTYKAENTWKNKKLVPVTLKLVELDKVIEAIADELQTKEISDEEIKNACATYFLDRPKAYQNIIVAWREAIKWYRNNIKQ